MPKDHGKTLTRLFLSATQSFGMASVDEAFAEFVQAGWEEQRDPGTGFRCLVRFDADLPFEERVEQALTRLYAGFDEQEYERLREVLVEMIRAKGAQGEQQQPT